MVGHLDLIKRNADLAGYGTAWLDAPRIRAAADLALGAARTHNAILDLNTAGWRKGRMKRRPLPPS